MAEAPTSAAGSGRGKRAPGMSQADRRAMIVQTALPLLAEHGAAVTTAQIARAAGIGEATIFRAFTDKNELLDACVQEAIRPDRVLAEIASIPLDQPLSDRLTTATATLRAHLERIGTVVGALHATGGLRRRGSPPPEDGRTDSVAATREALAALLEPDAAHLRTSPDRLAGLFMGMIFSRPRVPLSPGEPEIDIEELVDIFLNGAVGKTG